MTSARRVPADPRARRRSFERIAQAYAQARPPYPRQVYELLADRCGLGAGSRVLEIGPGTGQATAELLARGAQVVAVEPGPGLAAVLADRLGRPELQVVVADFEHADLPAGPYHLAVSATAFHWVNPARALPRLAGLLAPDGWLAVWWTVFADPDRPTEFRVRLDQLYQRYLPRERRDRPGPLRTASWTTELRKGGWFGPVDVDVVRWTHRLTPHGARCLWGSFPNVNELDPADRVAFLDALAELVDSFGGAVDDPYVTAVYCSQPSGAQDCFDQPAAASTS